MDYYKNMKMVYMEMVSDRDAKLTKLEHEIKELKKRNEWLCECNEGIMWALAELEKIINDPKDGI